MRIFSLILGLLLLLPAMAFAGTRVTIPGGTQISVHILDRLDSGTANVGDTFTFKTVDDVVVDGYVVVRSGAEGRGTVAKVDRAGRNGHAGSLGLRFDYVNGVDGKQIKLSSEKSDSTGSDAKGRISTATIASVLTLGYAGFFAHNFVRGHNITISSDQTFIAYVSAPQRVLSNERTSDVNDPFSSAKQSSSTPQPLPAR